MQNAKETCRKIQESYLSLCICHPDSKVKVKDIMEHAGLSKSTFYLNYQNTGELLAALIDETASRLCAPFARQPDGDTPAYDPERGEQFIRNVLSHRQSLLVFQQQGGTSALLMHLSYFLRRAIVNRLRGDRCPVPAMTGCADLLTQGFLQTLLQRLENTDQLDELLESNIYLETLLCRITAA
ncbi:MAG: TetR/AcrR family transcriptional regulator [Oscillospiraceae bacterium]|nr:TetR/AcrR family transcriptional regulator [Oscillospiraceae bacterium]